jgi:prepilin-type N-terminal cleavage/methylation domain-containing protein
MQVINESGNVFFQALMRLIGATCAKFGFKPRIRTQQKYLIPLEIDHGEQVPFFRLRSGGFSLIECILAISIAAMLVVVAMPRDNSFQSPLSLDAAARKIKADIRYAQNMATTTGDVYGFRVTSPITYEIYNAANGALAQSPFTNQPMQENLGENFGNAQFYTTYQVQFDDDGKPVSGGGTVIRLMDGSASKYLEVTPSSGLVRTL